MNAHNAPAEVPLRPQMSKGWPSPPASRAVFSARTVRRTPQVNAALIPPPWQAMAMRLAAMWQRPPIGAPDPVSVAIQVPIINRVVEGQGPRLTGGGSRGEGSGFAMASEPGWNG